MCHDVSNIPQLILKLKLFSIKAKNREIDTEEGII